MLEKFFLLFRIPELRRKILLTIFLLFVYRMGFYIPLPFIDQERLFSFISDVQSGESDTVGDVMQIVSVFSASNVGGSTIFGLGIMPYISASIIFQLLGSVYPPLEKLQKEGEAGRRKINEYTRYATVLICLVQSWFFIQYAATPQAAGGLGFVMDEYNSFYFLLVCTLTMTTGSVFLMWIGEQIDAYGIGNGISLLIMAGIVAQMPSALNQSFIQPAVRQGFALGTDTGIERLLLLAGLFVFVVVVVVMITQGQRRIPIQSAKHVRGRRVMGGQRQFLPLRVNQAGVMPIIFASSLLIFPTLVIGFIEKTAWGSQSEFLRTIGMTFTSQGYIYNLLYIALIYFFCYFWTAITFNPRDMAENLKDYGSFIPGYRPGTRTANYLEAVMVRITYVGAAFLSIVAVIPILVGTWLELDFRVASFYGGTGLLIVVSVVLDLVQKIDSHLVMRNYSGLLDSEK